MVLKQFKDINKGDHFYADIPCAGLVLLMKIGTVCLIYDRGSTEPCEYNAVHINEGPHNCRGQFACIDVDGSYNVLIRDPNE